MAANSTLLCIHRDPDQLSLLQEHGYELLTATNGSDGLRLFMSRPVDAIVLDYRLGLLDGGVVAAEIKKVKPQVPIVMLAEDVELPDDALKSVDALVSKSDGPHFLLASLRSVLDEKPSQSSVHRQGSRTSWDGVERRQANLTQLATEEKNAPLSPTVWRGIRDGTVQF
jgi:DNA-binding response OmpR family regulator